MNVYIRSCDTNLTFWPYVWEAQEIYRLFSTMSISEKEYFAELARWFQQKLL